MTIFQRLINWLSIVFAISLVTTSVIFAYALLSPIDVVTDWTLHVNPATYHPGDQIVVHASYTKLKDMNGDAFYYLECRTPRGSLVRYFIVQAKGNRPKGAGKADIPLHLPDSTPDLPADCRIAVSVEYDIYSFRKFVENNESNYFKVEE